MRLLQILVARLVIETPYKHSIFVKSIDDLKTSSSLFNCSGCPGMVGYYNILYIYEN